MTVDTWAAEITLRRIVAGLSEPTAELERLRAEAPEVAPDPIEELAAHLQAAIVAGDRALRWCAAENQKEERHA